MKQNNSLGIYSGYCSFVTDGYEMDFNVLLLQGAEQAQSPEVVLRERTRQLSKNSVRVALLISGVVLMSLQFAQAVFTAAGAKWFHVQILHEVL